MSEPDSTGGPKGGAERTEAVRALVERVDAPLNQEVASRVTRALQALRESLHRAVDAWYEEALQRANQPTSASQEQMLRRELKEFIFPMRAIRVFWMLDVRTLGDLVKKTADELLESKNFGKSTLTGVRQKLQELGLKLKGE